ncbi:MAG TPA: SPOR domain-containing protein [Candidatus Sulfotelmatobacter sp.]|jgi:cell division septation protein DedD
MASTDDTEITLGTGKLLVLFFGLVAICALFFALGYSLGRKSEPALTTASAAVAPQTTGPSKTSGAATPPMTFYKSVEQKDANPELTPVADPKTDTKADTKSDTASAAPPQTVPTPSAASSSTSSSTQASNAPDPTVLPTAAYFVQVAAVSKDEDANSLVDALKKKQYPAFVAQPIQADKLFRVQVGPFSDIKDAETMRARLIADGYSPILKK